MNFINFEAGNKNYKLRLTTGATVALEKQLGCNPISIFGKGDTIPTIGTMVAILHASLQAYHHGITLKDTYDIFDAWIEEGHVMTDFIPVIVEIYKASGFMKEDSEEKNA